MHNYLSYVAPSWTFPLKHTHTKMEEEEDFNLETGVARCVDTLEIQGLTSIFVETACFTASDQNN